MWSFFDAVKCITVDPRSARAQELREHLRAVGLHHAQMAVFPASPQSRNVAVNAQETTLTDILKHGTQTVGPLAVDLCQHHVAVVRAAYASGAQNLLVLEDDAHFDVQMTAKQLPAIVRWLKENTSWSIFNFGAIAYPFPICVPVGKFVAVAPRPLLAHSYALSRLGMQKLLESWDGNKCSTHIHADNLLADIFPVYHVANPPICFQTQKPALFRQAVGLLPSLPAAVVNHGTFKDFCLSYWQISQAILLASVVSVMWLVTRRLFRVHNVQ